MNETTTDHEATKAARSKPVNIDVMEAGYERFLADQTVDISATAQEFHPAEPGDLSGAQLIISLPREDAAVHLKMGCHNLGLIAGVPLFRFLAESLAIIQKGSSAKKACGATLADYQPIDGRLSIFRLHVTGEPVPVLTIVGGQHVFGVIRGEALRRFLDVAMLRTAFGKKVPITHLAIATDVVRACFNAPQDLGEVRTL
jgi:hypothetical protein